MVHAPKSLLVVVKFSDNYFICATLGLREHLKATVLEVFLKYLKIPESLQSVWIKKMM